MFYSKEFILKKLVIALLFCVSFGTSLWAQSKLNVVAVTPDLADITREVGGEYVRVGVLMQGWQDPHHVDPKPSMVMQLRQADLLIRIGMDLDSWVDSLIQTSRQSRFVNADSVLNASLGFPKLDIPQGAIDGRSGDIHLYGNPHYWLDPENVGVIALNVAQKLGQRMPQHADYFLAKAQKYKATVEQKADFWKREIKPFKPVLVVTYHQTWPYFAKAFGLQVVAQMEPKPGIPPSPKYLIELEKKMKQMNVKIIIVEPWQNIDWAKQLGQRTGAEVLVLAPSVGAIQGVNSYLSLIDFNLSYLKKGLQHVQ